MVNPIGLRAADEPLENFHATPKASGIRARITGKVLVKFIVFIIYVSKTMGYFLSQPQQIVTPSYVNQVHIESVDQKNIKLFSKSIDPTGDKYFFPFGLSICADPTNENEYGRQQNKYVKNVWVECGRHEKPVGYTRARIKKMRENLSAPKIDKDDKK